jgi:hypothetical protein
VLREEVVEHSPCEVGNPSGSPPDSPPLFGVPRPAGEACERLYTVAWRYAPGRMEIMGGVRKGLKCGKEAVQRAGGQTR